MLTDIKKYLDKVCEQIRFQKAHPIVQKELEDHIVDQTEAFVLEGMPKTKAVEKAIEQMGDPVMVGAQLDRVYRPKTQWSLIFFVILFSIVGFILQYNIKNTIYHTNIGMIHTSTLLAFIIGMGMMILFYFIDFTILVHKAIKIYICYVSAMGIVFVLSEFPIMGYPVYVNGAPQVPPLIYLFPIIFTGVLYHFRAKSYGAIVLCMCSMILPILFTSNTKFKTACFLIVLVNICLMTIAIVKNWFAVRKLYALLLLYIPMLLAGCFTAMLPFVRYRLHIALLDPDGEDYIRYLLQNNVKEAALLGKGGLITLPSGETLDILRSIPYQLEYLPTYILHCGGWVLLIIFLAMYLFFLARGFLLARKQKSQLGFMTAMAILLTFSAISIWNIISNSGFFFYFNFLEIPFFSHGGTLYILFFIMMGILLSVFRTGNCVKDSLAVKKTAPFMKFENGTLIIHLFPKKDRAK